MSKHIDYKDRTGWIQSLWISLGFVQAFLSLVGMSIELSGSAFVFLSYIVWGGLVKCVKIGMLHYTIMTHGAKPSLIMALASNDWLCILSYGLVIGYEYNSEVMEGATSGRNSILIADEPKFSITLMKADPIFYNPMYTHKRKMGSAFIGVIENFGSSANNILFLPAVAPSITSPLYSYPFTRP